MLAIGVINIDKTIKITKYHIYKQEKCKKGNK
jgi:hypothetical protein